MEGSHRQTEDTARCCECGDIFNLLSAKRQSLTGGRYQPVCHKCAKSAEFDGEVSCTSCGCFVSTEAAQYPIHVHPIGGQDRVSVCSQKCAISHAVGGTNNWDTIGDFGSQYNPPDTMQELYRDYRNEKRELGTIEQKNGSDRGQRALTQRYICLSAAWFIQEETEYSSVVDTRLVKPGSNDAPIVLSHSEKDVTDRDIQSVSGLPFTSPSGEYLLTVGDLSKQHQGFGVCKFKYKSV